MFPSSKALCLIVLISFLSCSTSVIEVVAIFSKCCNINVSFSDKVPSTANNSLRPCCCSSLRELIVAIVVSTKVFTLSFKAALSSAEKTPSKLISLKAILKSCEPLVASSTAFLNSLLKESLNSSNTSPFSFNAFVLSKVFPVNVAITFSNRLKSSFALIQLELANSWLVL